MDNSSIGLAWGRLASHRRARSGQASTKPSPIEFTSEGTRYTPEPLTPATTKSTMPSHMRSQSWAAPKMRRSQSLRLPQTQQTQSQQTPPQQQPTPQQQEQKQQQIYFQFADFPHCKAALTTPNPLELHRASTSTKSSKYSHKTNNSSSSISTKNTSLSSSSSPGEDQQKPFQRTPPQRPPRPARGLFDDDSDEEHAEEQITRKQVEEEQMQGLMRESDRAFQDVGIALADVAYNTYVAQAKPDMLVLSRGSSMQRRRQGVTPPVAARRSSIHSTRSVKRSSIYSAHSDSGSSHIARVPTTKKMGKRNVLLPRKLRWTLSQSVADIITSRAAKRSSASSSLESTFADDMEHHPSHKRNSSITAAKRQSTQQSKRFSTESRFSLYTTDSRNLTASQMYHRDMLPNSVMAWMGTDMPLTDEEDLYETDEGELSNEFEDKCNLESERMLPESPAAPETALSAASPSPSPSPVEESPLSTESSPPPPPPKNPARFGARVRTSELPPIPETPAAATDGDRRRRRSSLKTSPKSRRGGTKAKVMPRDSLYLIGTAYSKASPLFRHGHIEFQQRSPKAKEEFTESDAADDQVDWAKFHSSIMADVGDLDSGTAQDESNAMAEDLGEWFEEFGFESHGTLVKSGRTRKTRRSSHSLESARSSASSSSTISDADLPMPASPERSPFAKMKSWSFGQAERNASLLNRDEHVSDPIPVVTERELGLNTYGLPPAEEPTTKQATRSTSGPRMSCNLSEDLGQFLAWNPTHFNDIDEEDE